MKKEKAKLVYRSRQGKQILVIDTQLNKDVKRKQSYQAYRFQQISHHWSENVRFESTLSHKTHPWFRRDMDQIWTSDLATDPAEGLIAEWSLVGCPLHTGCIWIHNKIKHAIAQWSHKLARLLIALENFHLKAEDTYNGANTSCQLNDIEVNPPEQIKISIIAAIPQESCVFCSVLHLSFPLQLKHEGVMLSNNSMTLILALTGAINQISFMLLHLSEVFADMEHDGKIFMVKFDI